MNTKTENGTLPANISSLEELKTRLKQLVVEECDVDLGADEISDQDLFMGEDSRLGLDSLDALTIALEVKAQFGRHIGSGKEAREALASIDALAAHIISTEQ